MNIRYLILLSAHLLITHTQSLYGAYYRGKYPKLVLRKINVANDRLQVYQLIQKIDADDSTQEQKEWLSKEIINLIKEQSGKHIATYMGYNMFCGYNNYSSNAHFLLSQDIAELTTEELLLLDPKDFGDLQQDGLTHEQINALGDKHIKQLNLNKLRQEQIDALNPHQIAALNWEQIDALFNTPMAQRIIQYRTPDQLLTLSDRKIHLISTDQIKQIDISRLNKQQVQALTSDQIKALTYNQVAALTGEELSFFTRQQMEVLPPLSAKQINAIPPSKLIFLTAEQVKGVKKTDLHFLTENHDFSSNYYGFIGERKHVESLFPREEVQPVATPQCLPRSSSSATANQSEKIFPPHDLTNNPHKNNFWTRFLYFIPEQYRNTPFQLTQLRNTAQSVFFSRKFFAALAVTGALYFKRNTIRSLFERRFMGNRLSAAQLQ